jgi:hypothetical protein
MYAQLSAVYETGPLQHHLKAMSFQGLTRETLASWSHFAEMFRAYRFSDISPTIIYYLRKVRDEAAFEWRIAQCARLLFIAPTEHCARVHANLTTRINALARITDQADYLIDLIKKKSPQNLTI